MANRSDRSRSGQRRTSGDAERSERTASRRTHSTGSSRPSNSSRASRTARSARASSAKRGSASQHTGQQRAVGSQRSGQQRAAAQSGASDSRSRTRTQREADTGSARSRTQRSNKPHKAVSRTRRPLNKERADRKQRAAESMRSTPALTRADDAADGENIEFESATIGQIRRAERAERARAKTRRYIIVALVIVGVVAALVAGWMALRNSSAFTITNIQVEGVEHLTNDEMAQLVDVPANSTLLRVDTAAIEKQVEQNAWVADAKVTRIFPDTLQVTVTERPIAAVVYISTGGGTTVKRWLISDDHVWLMPVPDADSEAAQTTSSKVFEDADNALHIMSLPYGTKAEIGKECTDDIVNNALDILSGMTTDLSSRVAEVSAPTIADTTLILDDGVEVAFGKAEDIRDKERVVLELLEQNPNQITYINVRIVEQATYRSI